MLPRSTMARKKKKGGQALHDGDARAPLLAGEGASATLTDASTQTKARPLALWKAVVIVAVFSLHNGWNCFVFLDFANYPPVNELLHIDDSQTGFINSMGWFGILSTLPLVTVCTWHRCLLVAVGQ